MDKARGDSVGPDSVEVLQKAILNRRSGSDNYRTVRLLPEDETRKLLGRLLLNAQAAKSEEIVSNAAGVNSNRASLTAECAGTFLRSEDDARRAAGLAKELYSLLNQLVDAVNVIVDTYKGYQDDLASVLKILRHDASSPRSRCTGPDIRVLYTVRLTFRNAERNIMALERQKDASGSVSLPDLNTATGQLCNSARALLRLLRSTAARWAHPDLRESPDSYHLAGSLSDLLIKLVGLSQSTVDSFTSIGIPAPESVRELLGRLHRCAASFHLHVMQSFEEKRHLRHLLAELEVQKMVRESTARKGHQLPQQRPRLVSYRPDFRPKGYLLPLPLADRRQRMKEVRMHQSKAHPSPDQQDKSPPSPDQPDRVLSLEKRLEQLEKQFGSVPSNGAPATGSNPASGHPSRPFLNQIHNTTTRGVPWTASRPLVNEGSQRVQRDRRGTDLASILLDMLPLPGGLNHGQCRQVVQDTVDELSEEIARICDEITDDIFINEITEASNCSRV